MMTATHPQRRILSLSLTLALWTGGALAHAQTGVSDDRVSLPDGPGSLEGIGEDISVNPNMGAMSYSVPFVLPRGFAAVTPSLGLSYSSSAGSGVVGIGWSMDMPCVERMTYRGLPEYDPDDDFAASGGAQLVRVAQRGDEAIYRMRDEGGFTRFTWHARGDGARGYWVAEHPNGARSYFGADANGDLVPTARVEGAVKGRDVTFKYHLVETVDVFGNTLRYSYSKDGAIALLRRVEWVFVDGSPRYRADLDYEERRDSTGAEQLSDAVSGFDMRLSMRLREVKVYTLPEQIRSYRLSYEPYADSGGFTRLTRVESFGADGGLYPAVQRFTYSRALGGACRQEECGQPFTRSMGSVGVDLRAGQATLLDINGDALPDLLQTRAEGPHRFFLSVPDPDGNTRFSTTPTLSALGDASALLGTPLVHVLDANGDGFTDLLNIRTGQLLKNTGAGDWTSLEAVSTNTLPQGSFQLGSDNVLTDIRFIDYDNDKKIDILRGLAQDTQVYRNLGDGGFESDAEVEDLGVGFADSRLDLADMNGDGLLDVVQLLIGGLQYRLNLGWGQWGDWISVANLPIIDANTRDLVSLEDLNGDALADLVLVSGFTVQYAINRNGMAFLPTQRLDRDNINAAAAPIPERTPEVTVLYADMNGNGSNDVVWVDPNGAVTYLEIFPVRPNLLSKIENSLGHVTEITYATSVQMLALDALQGRDWRYKLPHPMIVVAQTDDYDLLTDLHEVIHYRYHDGFYDGIEKQFRGYAQVEQDMPGDEFEEDGWTIMTYDVGAEDRYRKGLMLSMERRSGPRTLRRTTTEYEDCDLAEIPPPQQLDLPIRWLCKVAEEEVHQEGTSAPSWVTTRAESQYDGYGNVRAAAHLGVTARGGGACAPCDRDPSIFGEPCGPQCLGDEASLEVDYIAPGPNTDNRWILNAAWRERSYGRAGSAQVKETMTYYDGEPFVGLPSGRLTLGTTSRVTARVSPDSDKVIAVTRYRYDTFGNIIEVLDPLGAPDSPDHRKRYTMDDEHLRVIQTDLFLVDPEGQPYQLRREFSYDPQFRHPSEATAWMRVVDGEVLSQRRSTFYQYDEFGRLAARVLPGGDTPQSPTETYTYELGSPISRIVTRVRARVGQPQDLESVACLDGRGRTFQTRERLREGLYQVDGHTIYNRRSKPVRSFQPYQGERATCDPTPPEGVLSRTYFYDASERILSTTLPDASIYGEPSRREVRYEPLRTLSFDQEDADPDSPFTATPEITEVDGQGRVVKVERLLSPSQIEATHYRYDELGRPIQARDPGDNSKIQTWDLVDRVTSLTDPNCDGVVTFTYNDANRITATTDERGVTVLATYDGLNRPIARWEEGREAQTLLQWRYDHDPSCEDCTYTEGELVRAQWPMPSPWTGQGVDLMGYDARARPTYEARAFAGQRFARRMTYDNVQRLISTTYPDGTVIEQQWDDASRPTATPGFVEAVTYDERGLLSGATLANGVQEDRTYDALMRLEAAMTTDARGRLLQGFAYQRNRVDDLLQITDLRDDGARQGPSYDLTARYDAWYRLLEISYGDAETLSMTYDAIENMASLTSSRGAQSPAHLGDLTYGPRPNALTRAAGRSLGYDAAGYQTARDDLNLTWDFLGRLTLATRADQPVARFAYGPNQDRLIKRDDHGEVWYIFPDFELRDGIASTWIKLGGSDIARTSTDTLAARVLPDPSQDDAIRANDAWLSLQRDTPDEGAAQAQLRAAARRLLLRGEGPTVFLHRDHQGSNTLATDAQGDVLGQRAFYTFGLTRPDSYGGDLDPYGYTGQELDHSTGLLHFQARLLDPLTGRWTSIDPNFKLLNTAHFSNPGEALSAYAYVANNPLNHIDSTGLALETVKLGDRYIGENKGRGTFASEHGKGGDDFTVHTQYLNKRERAAYRVFFKDGLLKDQKGSNVDTSNAFTGNVGVNSNSAIFVVDKKGNFYIQNISNAGEFHHSSFLAGAPVAGAGTIQVKNGQITHITNVSGHYQPKENIHKQVIRLLIKNGANLSNTSQTIQTRAGSVAVPSPLAFMKNSNQPPQRNAQTGQSSSGITYANNPGSVQYANNPSSVQYANNPNSVQYANNPSARQRANTPYAQTPSHVGGGYIKSPR